MAGGLQDPRPERTVTPQFVVFLLVGDLSSGEEVNTHSKENIEINTIDRNIGVGSRRTWVGYNACFDLF